MPAIEFDIVTVVAIWMGGVILLVPLMALTARFGIAPLLDAVARLRAAGSGGAERGYGEMDERFATLEARVVALSRAVARLESADVERHAPLV